MRLSILRLPALALGLALAAGLGQASAATCGKNPSEFPAWLQDFKAEAVASGISQRTVNAALNGVTYDSQVIRLDRNQKHFKQPFEVYSKRVVSSGRVARGKQLLKQYSNALARIEKAYGVPGPILIAIWGMETDFGAGSGNMSTFRSLATLAFDCRRTDFFQEQLLDALKIVERGDLQPGDMRGAWAGEIGQTQFMASSYVRFAVDFDGDGHADLRHSPVDVLASTANYLKGYGWQRGGSWEEGSANFNVLRQWNKAEVYAKSAALFADKLVGKQ
ncbi:lytic murein transglycosylase [Kaistia dalseonensis]|uniref:Lytic murein transglycosylase n=1 Tax=Kaistia dalseonensis TaxID=410840 RepID=A0ABU0H5W8_9HYPH|nr:lytic murein transglycosylase [Kaistia dalseonensis]MCX5495124.1 lytic murein transglycosylase [Kaistia dalseonensis]MDQ0437706.1 lytic murein transglycosylase [Kaistia dalseonensis]